MCSIRRDRDRERGGDKFKRFRGKKVRRERGVGGWMGGNTEKKMDRQINGWRKVERSERR